MKKVVILVLALILIFGAALKVLPMAAGWPKDPYLTFTNEVWDTIKTNYWEKINDDQLAGLFVAAAEKITIKPQTLAQKDRQGVDKLVAQILKEIPEPDKKRDFVASMADLVLANLQPFGRSRLYTQKEEKSLSNNVNNISGVDQYGLLGVPKEASAAAIQKAYDDKSAALKKANTPEAKQQLAELNQAQQTLTNQKSRQLYDTAGVETTVEYRILNQDIFYLHLLRFSPTTLDDLTRAAGESEATPLATTLILDLRDNIGGAIDGLPWFLGPFLGADQPAYQLYHQGNKTDFKTSGGWLASLVKFKKVVILINENSQSTAELMAATLKKYNVGVLVGRKTKGWGTIEKVFPLTAQLTQNEKYSIFLVHSLALREDGQPIEGRGVEPVIDIGTPGWEKELYNYFRYPELTAELKKIP